MVLVCLVPDHVGERGIGHVDALPGRAVEHNGQTSVGQDRNRLSLHKNVRDPGVKKLINAFLALKVQEGLQYKNTIRILYCTSQKIFNPLEILHFILQERRYKNHK